MEAKDLRIGNYYQENGKVYKAAINDIVNLVRCESSNVISDMKPIKLTNKWYIDYGFLDIRYKGDPTCDMYLDDFYVKDLKLTDYENINYVHELQNLYFAITGRELELKNERNTCG